MLFGCNFYCRNRTDARCVSCDPKTVFDGRYTLTCFISWCSIRLFLNLNPDLTTLLIVIIAAVILEYLRTLYRSYSEISIAILMSGGFGISIGPYESEWRKLSDQYPILSLWFHRDHYSGSSLVSRLLFLAVFVLFFLFKRPMYVLTFDEDTAHVDRLPVRIMSMLLMF